MQFVTDLIKELVSVYRYLQPQRPKPIKRISADRDSFIWIPIGSEGRDRAGIGPMGHWEIEFLRILCIFLNICSTQVDALSTKLFHVCVTVKPNESVMGYVYKRT